jgi:hypothetical protein
VVVGVKFGVGAETAGFIVDWFCHGATIAGSGREVTRRN